MKPKLSEVASVAEIMGAVAIVISLIYVGIQVQDSTPAVRSATANDISAAMASWYITTGNDSESIRIILDGITNPDSLSREENGAIHISAARTVSRVSSGILCFRAGYARYRFALQQILAVRRRLKWGER